MREDKAPPSLDGEQYFGLPKAENSYGNYASLYDVLSRAYQQASSGKGNERHGQALPFEQQPMQSISGLLGTHGGLLYQAVKKVQESQRLPHDAAVFELLGAINYLAGAVIYLEQNKGE